MEPRIRFEIETDLNRVFSGLLGFGFFVDIHAECSLKEFLSHDMGLDTAYINDRIQTIFLDGKAVDTIDDCVIRNGSSIALSAAMPGLVGATLRRKSHYAAMRGPISHTDKPSSGSSATGSVTVKLFNMIAKELGNDLLENGIRINGDDFKRFISSLDKRLVGQIKAVYINNKRIDPTGLLRTAFQGEKISLQVQSH